MIGEAHAVAVEDADDVEDEEPGLGLGFPNLMCCVLGSVLTVWRGGVRVYAISMTWRPSLYLLLVSRD